MPFRKIKLYGKLGKLFGKEWVLDVNTVGEALRAIDINTNGKFQKYLYNGPGAKIHYKVCVKNKKNTLTKEEINTPYEKGDIYIIPVIKGSGKGVFQTILGAVLVVVGLVINYITFGSGSPVGGYFIKTGIALALGGIAQMLSPNPNTNDVERKSSYLFQGNAMTANQGSAVGTIYGRAIVNPMPICISMDNIDENTYQGEIVNIGAVGPIDESLILYSSKSGTATLCGFDEFTDISTPPKKYRKKYQTGNVTRYAYWEGTSLCWQVKNSWEATNDYILYSKTDCTISGIIKYTINQWIEPCHTTYAGNSYSESEIIPGGHEIDRPPYSSYEETSTSKIWSSPGGFDPALFNQSVEGSCAVYLTEEDTELDAISRLLNSLSWSDWQITPIYPFYYRNPSGFNIYYQAVKTKSITLPDKYNPGLQYLYSATIQRRAYGSSDSWIDAETISTVVTPQSDGTLILPELEIPNESGYESKITSPSINYA